MFGKKHYQCERCGEWGTDETSFNKIDRDLRGRTLYTCKTAKPCSDYVFAYPPEYHAALEELLAKAEAQTSAGEPETFPLYDPQIRNRHLYVIGKTRMGKTVHMHKLAVCNFQQGDGVCFIDPHGDAVYELLAAVPPERASDVVYFDPTSSDCPRFNLFALPYDRAKLTEDILSAFRMFFGVGDAPRLEHLLRYSITTLLHDRETHTIGDLRRLLLDSDFRDEITGRASDENIRQFWEHDYPTDSRNSTNAVLNKLSAVLAPSSALARVVSDPVNDLDFPTILRDRKILLANLSKGKLGDAPSRLLGGLITTGIQQAALARAETTKRPDFYFYVDEFHNYTVASFETILAESAKYRLNLTLANQTLSQLPHEIQHAILGNVGTIVAFQVSSEDAPRLHKEIRGNWLQLPDGRSFRSQQDFDAHHAHELADELKRLLAAAKASPYFPRYIGNDIFPRLKFIYQSRDRIPGMLIPPVPSPFPPDPSFFQNLQPLTYIMRVGSPQNVYYFSQPLPDPPNEQVRANILARQREDFTKRTTPPPISPQESERIAPTLPATSQPSPPRAERAEPSTSKKPYNDDDYKF